MKGTLTVLTVLLLTPLAAVHAADRPNIVIILADDYGAGSANCLGADRKLIRTPSIDRLAAEGRRFTDANTTSSVCSPTRYSLLTGRYCWRTSLTHEVLGPFSPLHIEPGRLNLASLLKKHGYGTAAIGKWHLGYGRADESPKWRVDYTAELSPGPLDIGFDYHFSVPANHGDLTGVYVENRFVYGLRSGKIPPGMKIAGPAADSDDYQPTYGAKDTEAGKGAGRILDLDAPRRKNERVMKVLTDQATQWLEAQPKDRPFFLYFTPVAVHNPVTPDKDIAGQSAAGPFGDWIHELDRSVGRILETLDRIGAAPNTLVIFASDNGGVCKPEIERLTQTTAIKAGLKVNGDFRGGKHDVWEGGFRSPFLVRWPGKAAAGSVTKATVSLVDILATVAAVVGEPLPPVKVGAEDSRSFLPVLLGDPSAKGRDDLIVHSADGTFALRKGPWKWIEGVPVDEITAGARKSRQAQHRPQLYNLELDPAETKDVSAQHPEVVAELKSLLERYRDGGYSRELPPPGTQPAARAVATLAPAEGQPLLREAAPAATKPPFEAPFSIELIGDPHGRRGVKLKSVNPGPAGYSAREEGILRRQDQAAAPIWTLMQAYSKASIASVDPLTLPGGQKKWTNACKDFILGHGTPDADFVLTVNSIAEYGNQYRRAKAPWPHLLLEQKICAPGGHLSEAGPSLADCESMTLRVGVRLRYATNLHERRRGYSERIHAAQFLLYFTLQNLSRQSPGYGKDYVWFGVPFYDDRHPVISPSYMRDGTGQEDERKGEKRGTGRFINLVGTRPFAEHGLMPGEWLNVRADVLPLMVEALERAWSRGFCNSSTNLADYKIGSMNIGWELPGLSAVSAQIKDLSLLATGPKAEK